VDVFWPYLSMVDERLAAVAAAVLPPLALYILISGLDDLLVDLAWLRLRSRFARPPAEPPAREAHIAIFIPCWRESDVIGQMLEHNLAAIAWARYQVFVGAYPNDPETVEAVRRLKQRYPRVHLAMVPHDGPTSKPDCLNWIYRRMEEVEQEERRRFDLVLLHDAEDVIHPLALARLAHHAESAGMVQLAVLPMPTPASDWTHGVYCDDFAESQGKDLATRNLLGAFVPGCGVGTCFRRDALAQLAAEQDGVIFQPDALTEDYDTGLRLHHLGVRQVFVPLEFVDGAPLATREYFPRRVSAAVRQRTRWVTGNALQSWQRHGWAGGWVNRWYLWRDRKGLWGNPLSLLCNLLLLYGLASWAAHAAGGTEWALMSRLGRWPGAAALLQVTSVLFLVRLGFRIAACARVYGWRFAAGVPLRMLWGNWINCRATVRALGQFAAARAAGRPLAWVKTDHAYPTRTALNSHKRPLGDILVDAGLCTREQLERAWADGPGDLPLGEKLVRQGVISEEALYRALSLQQALPTVELAPGEVAPRTARLLPRRLQTRLKVLPFRVEQGALYLAGTAVPDDQVTQQLQRFTRLEIRFHLITPTNFAALQASAAAL